MYHALMQVTQSCLFSKRTGETVLLQQGTNPAGSAHGSSLSHWAGHFHSKNLWQEAKDTFVEISPNSHSASYQLGSSLTILPLAAAGIYSLFLNNSLLPKGSSVKKLLLLQIASLCPSNVCKGARRKS